VPDSQSLSTGRSVYPLGALILMTSPAVSQATAWNVRADTRMTADRWRGTLSEPVDRVDVRPRLFLGGWDFEGDGDKTQRFSLVADLELATDFGPTDTARRVSQPRRAMFELYQAELRWRERLSGHVTTDLKLGRQLLIDALTPGGWDALDGATLRLGLPYIVLEGTGGLAVRREWNALGPDVFAPDGAALPERPGYIVGAAAEVANIETVHARVGWRRQFEASDRVQREDVGGAITLGPWANASLESGARFDLIYHWLGEVYAQAGFGDADLWRLTAGWRYERPTFGADSIWNAFSVMPWQDLTLRGHVNPGLWRLNADAGARRFDAGPADAQAPGAELVGVVLPEDPATAGLNPHPIAWDGGARVTRWLDESGDLHVGAEARLGFGYGGRRHYGDVFGQVPVLGAGHFAPMFLTARLGAVDFEDAQRKSFSGLSGWGVLGSRWQVSESARFELVAEGHSSRFTPFRSRVFAQATLEDWL